MREWLSKDHLVWFLLQVLEELDVSRFEARARLGGAGRAPFDPRTLLGVLIYGYAHGQRSSRQLERLCEVDVAFRVLAGNEVPDHTTLARFRQRHDEALEELFTQVLVMCSTTGLGRLGMVAIDGTKIAANASKQANASEGALREKLARQVADILADADAIDAAEDAEYGDARGDELPPEWASGPGRAARIKAALADIEAERAREAQQQEQAKSEQVERAAAHLRRMTDPTVSPAKRVGRPPKGADPVAIAQARLDRQLAAATERERIWERRVAAAAALGRRPVGQPGVPAAQHAHVRQAQAQLDAALQAAVTPATSLSSTPAGKDKIRNITDPDSRLMPSQQGWVQGYNAQLAVTDDQIIVAIKLVQTPVDTEQFVPMMTATQKAADLIISNRPTTKVRGKAPEPERLGVLVADAGYLSTANLTADGPDRLIALGKRREQDQQAREHPTRGAPPPEASPQEKMGHRLRTPEGIALYKRRGVTVEPVNGHLKDRIGLRRFSRRGLSAASSELHLAAAVANLLKIYRYQALTH